MKPGVHILDPGLLSTVQDCGRTHVGAFGVSPAGYADWFSAQAANQLAGNTGNEALIETTLNGIAFSVACPLRIAITGADAPVRINGELAQCWQTLYAREGDRVEVGTAQRGVRNYVAVGGGIKAKPVLASASTDTAAGFGGFEGRSLQKGDVLQLDGYEQETGDPRAVGDHSCAKDDGSRANTEVSLQRAFAKRPAWDQHAVLRVLSGPDGGAVANGAAGITTDSSAPYAVTQHCNRQGVRLQGAALSSQAGWDRSSFGVCAGCVQFANDGQPIILLCNHQTTGGYGIPFVVISADTPLAAQLRPGDQVTFQAVNQAVAANALVERMRAFRQLT